MPGRVLVVWKSLELPLQPATATLLMPAPALTSKPLEPRSVFSTRLAELVSLKDPPVVIAAAGTDWREGLSFRMTLIRWNASAVPVAAPGTQRPSAEVHPVDVTKTLSESSVPFGRVVKVRGSNFTVNVGSVADARAGFPVVWQTQVDVGTPPTALMLQPG